MVKDEQPVLVVGAPEAKSGLCLRDGQFPATRTGGAEEVNSDTNHKLMDNLTRYQDPKIPDINHKASTTCHRLEHRQKMVLGHKIGSASGLQSPQLPIKDYVLHPAL